MMVVRVRTVAAPARVDMRVRLRLSSPLSAATLLQPCPRSARVRYGPD
jgi:hypothetical protein